MTNKIISIEDLKSPELTLLVRKEEDANELKISFSTAKTMVVDENRVRIGFQATIGDEKSWIYCRVRLTALAHMDNFADEKEDEQYMLNKSVGLLYPYIRTAVSTLFTTAGLKPLILPVVPTAYFESGKKAD